MSGSHASPPPSAAPEPTEQLVRRRFVVEAVACVVGAVTAIIPALAALAFVFTPLLKKKSSASAGDDGFRMVGSTTGLKPGGAPAFFRVTGIKKDAWTTYPSTPLGAVYVRQEEDGSLTCLNARCTHLGCMVSFRPAKMDFLCPCHASSFNIEGVRSNQIPPRNLDHLEVQVRNDDEIWVKFQNFRAGREAQIPV